VQTLRLKVDATDLDSETSRQAIARAAQILRGGGTVAFPTETVYGLGANALDAEAVQKIFVAKERPSWDPLIVHISERTMLERVAAEVTAETRRVVDQLSRAFWPGPLTILLPRGAEIPALVTAGLEKVAVRMPAHPVTRALLLEAGVPIAAPSANRFGRISPTTAEHVAEDLNTRIDAILDGGETTYGVESTVVDVQEQACVILRAGVITFEQLGSVSQRDVRFHNQPDAAEAGKAAPAPGMGERHYAPQARLVLVEGVWPGGVELAMMDAVNRLEEEGEVVGAMAVGGFMGALTALRKKEFDMRGFTMGYNAVHVYPWGSGEKPEELAKKLYAGLRWLDAAGVTAIVCPLPEPAGIGVAIRDRLTRAAQRSP